MEIITDVLNENSRRAILRLGAKEEGILRSHMQMPDGRVRDKDVFHDKQVSARGGEVHYMVKDDRIEMSGKVVKYLEGEIMLGEDERK